ncbi:lamin tail domain-containing protein [Haloferula sp. BvORR071]|uniref:lamin tail domain-containing protein n=1 Tax=Haloferula sp. BvORR071 TaxID=1396141 RepID=UPI000552F8AE|nr:lamin tail domain-containing protein [Haloferula sp. BvORR071]
MISSKFLLPWACALTAVPQAFSAPAKAVINEFHFKPEDGTSLEEFIEIHNPSTDNALNLSGWKLADAVEYTFPNDTTVAPGGYLVVAENPAVILAKYGKSALGPWTGKLSSGGDDIELWNAGGVRQDRVNYGVGFPWPTRADGGGSSVELIHPDLDNSLGGSWRSSEAPTPGATNSVYSAAETIPPQIRQVTHDPLTPVPGEVVTITARLTDPDDMGPVTLAYQTVDPGSYIRLTDAAYLANWNTVPMYDDGTHGDTVADDAYFTAVLPAALQTNRRLVRYRISFADAMGNSATVPYADDEQPNFAYYVYSGLPDWEGAFRPGSTPLQTFPASVQDDLPVYTLIANGTDVINSQYAAGSDNVRFRGTFVYGGEVYDHIEFKNRGEVSTYVSGKNKWRFFFNRARDLVALNNRGEEYKERWGSLSGNACASPWAAVNRGMAGIEEALSYKAFQLAGLPSPNTHYYHFRVVRGATETPAPAATINDPIGNTFGQYCGDFWGLYLAVESPDGSFLDERGLPDGNVYKMEGYAGDKKHQGRGQPTDSSDWNSFRDAHFSASPTEAWWRENMDLDAYNNFHAINRLIGNVDLRAGYNHCFYHRSSDNRWVPMPWDLDMMFIAQTHQYSTFGSSEVPGVILAHRATFYSQLGLEYRNRAREILDLLASDGSPGGGQFGQLVDEFTQIVNPAGQSVTWADADAAMWNLHPRTKGIDGYASGQSNHKGNFYCTRYDDSRIGGNWTRWLRSPASFGTMEHEDFVAFLRNYATNAWTGSSWSVGNGDQLGYGYQYLLRECSDSAIPARPLVTRAGDPNYPVGDLRFSSSAFSSPASGGTYARTQWRLAEISGPGAPGYVGGMPRKYEITGIWDLESIDSPGTVAIPKEVVEAGRTYRVRVRHQNTTGRWSHWSAPLQFIAGSPEPSQLVHYWNFNEAAYLVPNQSIGGASISLTRTSGGTGMTQNNAQDQGFTASNARAGDGTGSHLRLINPEGGVMTFAMPTTGYRDIVVKYESRRTTQGPTNQVVSYTTDRINYITFATLPIPDAAPILLHLDFRACEGANDNPLFGIRISNQQVNSSALNATHRFDNMTMEGTAISPPGTFAHWRAQAFPNPSERVNNAISGPAANPSGDSVQNILRYAFGVGPRDPVAHLMPALVSGDGTRRFRFRYDPALSDLRWRVLASNNLRDWPRELFNSTSSPVPPVVNGWLSIAVPLHLGEGPDADPEIFTRLHVELAE